MEFISKVVGTLAIILLIPVTTILGMLVAVSASVAMFIIFSVVFVVKMLSEAMLLWQKN